jgi:type IV secretory pathway TrbL component
LVALHLNLTLLLLLPVGLGVAVTSITITMMFMVAMVFILIFVVIFAVMVAVVVTTIGGVAAVAHGATEGCSLDKVTFKAMNGADHLACGGAWTASWDGAGLCDGDGLQGRGTCIQLQHTQH